MLKGSYTDAEAKSVLLTWPRRTKIWPPLGGKGFWIRGQPKDGKATGPRLMVPGSDTFKTQPDALWVHFNDLHHCDVMAIEVCSSKNNLDVKRSHYAPSSNSALLLCKERWFREEVQLEKGGWKARWAATASIREEPNSDIQVPVRVLRVLYFVPNAYYVKWCRARTPANYEYYAPQSALKSLTSNTMRSFLMGMSNASHFYARL